MVPVVCNDCKMTFEEVPDTPAEARTPCPSCGSIARIFYLSLEGTLEFHSSRDIRAKHGGRGKWFHRVFSGDELHRKTGQWMRKERTIDRQSNYYKEVVTDPKTGTVIHECEEPLDQHLGHGDDKKNKR